MNFLRGIMRLDKFCKVSRLLKRRTVSKELADHDRILVNGKPAKPSYEVKRGDEITILFGQRRLTVRVLDIIDNPRKEEAGNLYEIINEE